MRFMSRSRQAATLGAAVLALVLSSCANPAPSQNDGPIIGIANPAAAQPVMKAVEDVIVASAEREGWIVKTLDAANDPGKQVTDVDQLVAQKVDVIVVYPIDTNALAPSLKRAKDAGITLVGWSAELSDDGDIAPYDTNLDTGGTARGAKLLSDYVREQLGNKGNVLGVGLGVPVPALIAMVDNYKAGVSSERGTVWSGAVENPTDDIAGAQQVVADALTRFRNDIQAVMAYNDSSAIGASIALKNAGVPDAVVVGQNGDRDGAEAVADGRISATVDLVPWRQGLILTELIRAALAGQNLPAWVENPSELYTADNVEERLDWNEAITRISDGSLSCNDGGGCPAAINELLK